MTLTSNDVTIWKPHGKNKQGIVWKRSWSFYQHGYGPPNYPVPAISLEVDYADCDLGWVYLDEVHNEKIAKAWCAWY